MLFRRRPTPVKSGIPCNFFRRVVSFGKINFDLDWGMARHILCIMNDTSFLNYTRLSIGDEEVVNNGA